MKREPIGFRNKSISVIEKGMEFDENFWNHFIQLLNNPEGLSQLLDVPTNKIATWHEKIKDTIKEKEDLDKNKPVGKNNKLI